MTLTTIDGTQQVLPDGVTAAALHNQFIGNYQGLTELKRALDIRKAELEDVIKQQEQQERERTQP